VKKFIADLRKHWEDRPFVWGGLEDVLMRKVCLPTCGRVLVLSPHPDDPEKMTTPTEAKIVTPSL
jgi:hypothetical protein